MKVEDLEKQLEEVLNNKKKLELTFQQLVGQEILLIHLIEKMKKEESK